MKLFPTIPDLQHLTQVKYAMWLWSNYTFTSDLLSIRIETCEWDTIRNDICAVVDALQLSHSLKHSMKNYVENIGIELCDFLIDINFTCNFKLSKEFLNKFVKQIQWKFYGKIDLKKTTENLITFQQISVYSKFIIATHFCLSHQIDRYLNQIPYTKDIQKIILEVSKHQIEYGNDHPTLLNIYAHKYEIDCSKITSHVKRTIFNETIVDCFIEQTAIEYFWSLLEEDQRAMIVEIVVNAAKTRCIKIILFLLSKAKDEQMHEILSSIDLRDFCLILSYDWAYSRLYLPNFVSLIDNLLSNDEFSKIICTITDSIRNYDWIIEYVAEMWIKASYERKRFIIEKHEPFEHLMYRTVEIQDLYLAKIFLSDASMDERQRVLTSVFRYFKGDCLEEQFIEFLEHKFVSAKQFNENKI